MAGRGGTVVNTVSVGDGVGLSSGVGMSRITDMSGVNMMAAGVGACAGMEDEKCAVVWCGGGGIHEA